MQTNVRQKRCHTRSICYLHRKVSNVLTVLPRFLSIFQIINQIEVIFSKLITITKRKIFLKVDMENIMNWALYGLLILTIKGGNFWTSVSEQWFFCAIKGKPNIKVDN